MKNILVFALRMITLRLAVILLSLAQTTLWAAELGVAGFGLVSAFISAQVLLGLGARFGADNVLVRHFRIGPAKVLEQRQAKLSSGCRRSGK